MSNHIFLPSPDDSEDEIAKAYIGTGPPEIERRTPWIHATEFRGESLEKAKTPKHLFIAMFHGMLGISSPFILDLIADGSCSY